MLKVVKTSEIQSVIGTEVGLSDSVPGPSLVK